MTRALNWLSNFGRKLDFGLQGLGTEFRKVTSFFFRLSLVILFFWYFIESVYTLQPHHAAMAATLAIAALAVLATFLVIVVKTFREYDGTTVADRERMGGVIPFVLLNLPFVVAVGFANQWYGHSFPGGLLRFTQDLLYWIGRRLS